MTTVSQLSEYYIKQRFAAAPSVINRQTANVARFMFLIRPQPFQCKHMQAVQRSIRSTAAEAKCSQSTQRFNARYCRGFAEGPGTVCARPVTHLDGVGTFVERDQHVPISSTGRVPSAVLEKKQHQSPVRLTPGRTPEI